MEEREKEGRDEDAQQDSELVGDLEPSGEESADVTGGQLPGKKKPPTLSV